MKKKQQKIEKVSKNFQEYIKENVERIQTKHDKWRIKIEAYKNQNKHEEMINHKKGAD